MMSLETIREYQREAASLASEQDKLPFIMEQGDIDNMRDGITAGIRIPNLGDHCPNGWHRVDLSYEHATNDHGIYMGDNEGMGAYFVDSSGMGAVGEPALTMGEFAERLEPGRAYAVVEVGQFQVKVGVFAKGKAPKPTPAKGMETASALLFAAEGRA